MKIMLSMACLFAISAVLVLHSSSYAQSGTISTKTISYQGVLQGVSGQRLTGTHQLTVTLYEDEFGRSPFWSGNYIQNLDNGIFTVILGSGEYPLPTDRDLSHQIWVGVKVDNGEEMRPLNLLTGSPYSLSVVDGAITKEKIKADYVGSIEINGQKVTGNGTTLNIKSGSGVDLLYDEPSHSLSFNSVTGIGSGANPQFIATNPCGTNNDDGSPFNTISGGCGNTTIIPGPPTSWFSTVGGGLNNAANDNYSTVGGGQLNLATSRFSTIVGGGFNTANGCGAFVGGGGTDCDSAALGNTASGIASVVVGGTVNTVAVGSNKSFIGGGHDNNINGTLSLQSFIGGGAANMIPQSTSAGIVGGENNLIALSSFSHIGGGTLNTIVGSPTADIDNHNAIVGGDSNCISGATTHSIIGGGEWNQINVRIIGTTTNDHSGIFSGWYNTIQSPSSVICGGWDNQTLGNVAHRGAFIGGGTQNLTDGFDAVVTGGGSNSVASDWGAIVGGTGNNITSGSDLSFIGAGDNNTVNGTSSFIGSGSTNNIAVNIASSAIVAGHDNVITGSLSDQAFIGAGDNNNITQSQNAGIVAGEDNIIALSNFSFIGGGTLNTIIGSPIADIDNHNVIGGGDSNSISGNTSFSIIGGGEWNQINVRITGVTDNSHSGIFSGWYNTIQSPSSAICGGWSNQTLGDFAHRGAFIGGGTQNLTDGFDAVISGGGSNHVASDWGTIIGGTNNNTTLVVQTAGGYFNATRGVFPATLADAQNATSPVFPHIADDYNTPLFMLGNGKTGTTHNAFEVSYNGHAVVSDINMTGGATPGMARAAIKGATYVDNIIYAWGDVAGSGLVNSDFGVANVTRLRAGVYRVTLNLNTITGGAFTLANASITATLVDNTNYNSDPPNACGTILVSQIGGAGLAANQFLVRTFNNSAPTAPGDCTIADRPFMFKVTGR